MRVNKESKTPEEVCKNINVLDNIKNEIVSNYEVYNNIEVQTSEKPKSESRVGNIEEFSKTAEVLTSGFPISILLKNQNKEV